MTAETTHDGDQEKDTEEFEARKRELARAVRSFMAENVRSEYRRTLLQSWHDLGDAIEDPDTDPVQAVWDWWDSVDAIFELLIYDIERAGYAGSEDPEFVAREHAQAFVDRCAKAARSGEEEDVERAEAAFVRLGRVLGAVRAEVYGEAEDNQHYEEVELEPYHGRYEGGNSAAFTEEEDLETAGMQAYIVGEEIGFGFHEDGENDSWETSFTGDPETVRTLALQLMRVAWDAEHSENIDTDG